MVTRETSQNPGLCQTCNNATTCFHRARRGPALFCELFDAHALAPTLEAHRPGASPAPACAQGWTEEAGKYAGLCMNCEHRRACAHPKPDGGVWHCEDYE